MERPFNTRLQAEDPVVTDDGNTLQRFELKESIAADGSGDAWFRHWNYVTAVWENTTESDTLYDSMGKAWSNGARVWAKFMPDRGEYEIVGPGGGSTLWRFTLNEDMGATTTNEGAADLLEMDGTDTTDDVTVLDPLAIFSTLVDTDAGLCIEQDGMYYVIQAPC